MDELALALGTLGNDAITAFIVFQILETLELLTFFFLTAWGIRTVWKTYKKHEWRED